MVLSGWRPRYFRDNEGAYTFSVFIDVWHEGGTKNRESNGIFT